MKTYFKEIRYWFKQGGWFESLTLRVQTRRHFPPSLEEAEDLFLRQTKAETLQSDRLTGERTEKAAQRGGQSWGSWPAGAQEESHFWMEGAPPLPQLPVPMQLLERAFQASAPAPTLPWGRPPQSPPAVARQRAHQTTTSGTPPTSWSCQFAFQASSLRRKGGWRIMQ